ncbi:MAG: beta-galactosidase [Anaerolineae bacterium]|nr:beta-galactosidase [Anaerolineae bacterium]
MNISVGDHSVSHDFQRGLGRLARIVLVWMILRALAPAPPRAPMGTPQIVMTEKPMVCVHTRLIDEVYEWKIQRSLQVVREMGATTIVEFFPWAYAEPLPGEYNWESFDRIIQHAQNQGLTVIARMGLVPEWARQTEDDISTTLNDLPERSYGDFAEFVAAFASRYRGEVRHIIIWNEPNLSFEWGYRPVDPSGYAKLLKTVYPVVKAANPEAIILAAPLAPTLEPPGSPNGLNDLLYLEALYQAGAAPYFDGLAMHTYGFTDPPEAPPAADALNFRRAELLHDIMLRYDSPDKPVYITETGWNDHPRWTKAVLPSLRVAYTVDAFRWAEAHWPWLDKLCIWVLRYPGATRSYPDNFTLITPDFQPLPIYSAIQAYALGREEDAPLWLPAPGTP